MKQSTKKHSKQVWKKNTGNGGPFLHQLEPEPRWLIILLHVIRLHISYVWCGKFYSRGSNPQLSYISELFMFSYVLRETLVVGTFIPCTIINWKCDGSTRILTQCPVVKIFNSIVTSKACKQSWAIIYRYPYLPYVFDLFLHLYPLNVVW